MSLKLDSISTGACNGIDVGVGVSQTAIVCLPHLRDHQGATCLNFAEIY